MSDADPRSRVEKVASSIATRLRQVAEDPDRMTNEARSKLSVLVRSMGAERRSERLLDEFSRALSTREIYFDPDLTDRRLPFETIIRFSHEPPKAPAPDKALFPSEYAMEKFIAANITHLWGALELVKTQYEVPSGLIDILARDTVGGDFIVIELKKGRADRGVIAQTMSYVEDVRRSPKTAGHPVRASIISGIDDQKLREFAYDLAAARGVHLNWLIYSVSMSFEQPLPRYVDVQSDFGIVNPSNLRPGMKAVGR